MFRRSLLAPLVAAALACGSDPPANDDAASLDAAADATVVDAELDAASDGQIDASVAPPPCAVELDLQLGDAALPAAQAWAVRTPSGWLFAYQPPPVGAPPRGTAWTMFDFDGARLIAPTLLSTISGPPSVAWNGARALIAYTDHPPEPQGSSPTVRIIDLADRSIGPPIVLATGPGLRHHAAFAGPGPGFQVLTAVTVPMWADPSVTVVAADGAVGATTPLGTLGNAYGPAARLSGGDVAIGIVRERAVDNCFACPNAGHARLTPAGVLAPSWEVPFTEHYASRISSFTEIGQVLHVTWQSESPAFYVPVWFATLARDPGQVLLTLPWVGMLTTSAGGPREGVLGAARSIAPLYSYLQSFDSTGGFALGSPCTIDVPPGQLLAAGGDRVLAVGSGRAQVVTVPP